jgi:tryptophanyl-tRNA synthetase
MSPTGFDAVAPIGAGGAMARATVLTGVRPTGPLHLGHYAGALEGWVRLQSEHECFFLIADYQVADHAGDIERVRASVREVALDWLATGLDPERSHFVVESLVPQHAELTILLSWFVPLARLERNPTLKAEMDGLVPGARGVPVGFFIYPVMQVANILLPRAGLVPVGEDQLPHIEMTREIARRFNRDHGPVFVEPEALLGRVRRLVGTDGRAKMGKSLGNAIYLKDGAETVEGKVMSMFTDPTRLRVTDPGHVEGNPVFAYHDAFNPDAAEVEELKARYASGSVGDVEVKKRLVTVLNRLLDPIRERRRHFEAQPRLVADALARGSEAARGVAERTMEAVRGALRLDYARQIAGAVGGG